MGAVARIRRELRIILGAQHLVLLGILVATVIAYLDQASTWDQVEKSFYLAGFSEVLLPLLALLSFGYIFSVEDSSGAGEYVASYPFSRLMFFLVRAGIAVSLIAIAAALGLLALSGSFPVDFAQSLIWAIWPSLFLLGLAWTVGGSSTGLGLGIAVVYWLMDLFTRGAITGPFYLFVNTMPRPDIQSSYLAWAALAVLAVGYLRVNRALAGRWQHR